MLPKRFRNARHAALSIEGIVVDAVVADRFGLRLRGLSGLDEDELVPLLIPRCRSIHTFGMRTPIDVVWLAASCEPERSVLGVTSAVGPGRVIRATGSVSRPRTDVLELPVRR